MLSSLKLLQTRLGAPFALSLPAYGTGWDSGHLDDGGRWHVVLSAASFSLLLFSPSLHKHESRGAENPAAVLIHLPDCTAEKVICP